VRALAFRKVQIAYSASPVSHGRNHGLAADLSSSVDTDAPPSVGITVAQYLLPCATASLGVSRIPATATLGYPLALFLPGIMTNMNGACQRVIPLTKLFDVVICELPGHGISHEVDDVSPEAFAREYAAMIDRYIPLPQHVHVVCESFGGLVGAALARLRPDRVGHLILLDTPFCLTRPPLAALLTTLWQRHSQSPYHRRIFLKVFGFDPQDGTRREAVEFYSMLADLHTDCTILAGCENYAVGDPPVEWRPPSQLANADLARFQTTGQVTVLPRIEAAGHCLLLDNPTACVAALSCHLASRH
jgi:pimeloyl-ACP methyl ester carboxylesterase